MAVKTDIFQVRGGWMGFGCTEKGIGALVLPCDRKEKVEEEIKHRLLQGDLTQRKLSGGSFGEKKRQTFIQDLILYFEGEKQELYYEVDWDCCGYTDFQKKALMSTYRIPYGTSKTYREVAEESGHPKAYRAVGGAMNKNRIPLVVP